MSNPEIKDDEFIIFGNPEKKPGTPESYRKLSRGFEDAGCALAALGDLMIKTDQRWLSEDTFQGVGYMLNILSDNLMSQCLDALDLIPDDKNQKAGNDSVSAQNQH